MEMEYAASAAFPNRDGPISHPSYVIRPGSGRKFWNPVIGRILPNDVELNSGLNRAGYSGNHLVAHPWVGAT